MPLFYRLLTYAVLFSAIRMLIGGYASLYLIGHGLTIADISFLKSFQGAIIVLIQIPIGFAIDRCKRRYPFVLISIFLSAIWLFLTGFGTNSFYFYTAEFFNGLSLAIFNAVMLPILVETYTQETGKDDYNSTLGKFFKYQSLLMAASVIAGSIFVDITSRYMWIISGLMLLSIAFFSIITNDWKRFNFPSETNNKKMSTHFGSMILQIKLDCFASLLLANITLIAIFQILAQFWQVFIYDYLGNGTSHALVYGLFFSVILILQAIGSHIAEKKNSLNLSLFCVFLLIVSMGYLMLDGEFSSNRFFPISLFLSSFVLFKYPSVIISAQIHRNISNDIRSTFDATIGTLSMIVSIFIFFLVGILLKRFGNNVILLSLMVLSLLSFSCIAFYLNNFKRKLEVIQTEVSLPDNAI